MIFYIKDRYTFKTKGIVEGASWKLVQSVWTDLSELTVTNNESATSGDIIYNMDGWRGVISDIQRDNKVMSLKCQKIETLFDRRLMWTGLGRTQPCEFSIAYFLNNYYVNETDTYYAMPYLTVNRATLEAAQSQPLTTNGTFKVSSYIAQIRRLASVFTYFDISGDTLTARIQHENRGVKNIFTTNMPVEITENSFSKEEITAKVTTYKYQSGYPPVFNDQENWYLFEDGTISTDPTQGTRVKGKWELLEITDEDTPETSALNLFRSNNASEHKIIFRVPEKDARYDFYDPVNIEVQGHVYTSYISRKTVSSEGYVEYTCGDLQTSLTDKINELD